MLEDNSSGLGLESYGAGRSLKGWPSFFCVITIRGGVNEILGMLKKIRVFKVKLQMLQLVF